MATTGTVTPTSAAAVVDKQELTRLRIEQSQILSSIRNKTSSIKQKTRDLALNLKKCIELADPSFDPSFTVSQISTEIKRMFRQYGLEKESENVDHYLDAEYKNPNLARDFVIEDGRRDYGGIDPKLLIEELEALPNTEIEKLDPSQATILYDIIKRVKNVIESDALKRHYALNDKDQREAIRTSKPFEPRITKFGDAMRHLGNTCIKFGDWTDTNFPPPPDLEERWIKGPTTFASMIENAMNLKYSLTDPEWLSRDMYRIHQSKHGAAVKDKVETILCKACSKLDREKYLPGDFVEMEWDYQLNNWRCPECHGTDGVKRGMTREQCGDIAIQTCPHCNAHLNWEQGLSPIESRAIELANNLPIMYDIIDFIKTLPRKCTATRKVKLGVDLSAKA